MRARIKVKMQLPVDYAKIGDGPKHLVILPGIALKSTVASAEAVGALFDLFRDYTIWLIDDRSRVRKGYGLKKRADDAARVLKNNGVTEACVFGASMGGMVAQLLALHHPELVKKAVLASTSAQPAADMALAAEAFAAKGDALAAETLTANGEGGDAESSRGLEGWLDIADPEHLPELIRSMNRLIYSPATLSRYGEILDAGPGPVSEAELAQFSLLAKAVLRFDSLSELKKILCPVLVIGAEGDRLLGPGASRKLAEAGGFDLFLYGPEFGHAVYDEAPDFRQRMLDFFES